MIEKIGKVIISNDGIEVTGFHFEGVDFGTAQEESLRWAYVELSKALMPKTHTKDGLRKINIGL